MKKGINRYAISGWIARDEGGSLWIYKDRPRRGEEMWFGIAIMRIPEVIAEDINLTWDSEPIETEMNIGIKIKG